VPEVTHSGQWIADIVADLVSSEVIFTTLLSALREI
jgi:hypothetical protein